MCVFLLLWQGPVLGCGSGCQHHLQQDSGAGTSPAGHLPEPPRRHHCCGRRRPNGHQWVPVPVPVWTVELFGARREDGLRSGASSRSVWVLSPQGKGHSVCVCSRMYRAYHLERWHLFLQRNKSLGTPGFFPEEAYNLLQKWDQFRFVKEEWQRNKSGQKDFNIPLFDLSLR